MLDPRELDRVFGALAHRTRRRILDRLKAEPGATVGEVAAEFEQSRIAVLRHLRVLEEAGLVLSRREGRCRRLFLNPVPIRFIHDRWLTRWSGLWADRLAAVKYALEGRREPWARPGSSRPSRSARASRPSGRRSPGGTPPRGPTSTPSS